MTYREARKSAGVAGTVLVTMPIAEVWLGLGSPGPVHFVMGLFGIALLTAAVTCLYR
jgi:hypothetical protein